MSRAVLYGIFLSLMFGFFLGQAAPAQTPRDSVGSSLRHVESDTNKLVGGVQVFLQSRGRWGNMLTPADQQLTRQLQMFSEQVKRLRRDNRNKQPYTVLQSQVQQLQVSAANLDRSLQGAGVDRSVQRQWSSVRSSLGGVYQSFFGGGGFRPYNPYIPFSPGGGSYDGYGSFSRYDPNAGGRWNQPQRSDGARTSDTARALEKDTGSLVKEVQAYLMSHGRWTPPKGDDWRLCQSIERFQQQVKKVRSRSNKSMQDLYPDINELSFQASNVDQLLSRTGASQAVSRTWWNIKSRIRQLEAGSYTSGRGWRPF